MKFAVRRRRKDIAERGWEGAEGNKHVKAAIKGPEGEFVARDWCVLA